MEKEDDRKIYEKLILSIILNILVYDFFKQNFNFRI